MGIKALNNLEENEGHALAISVQHYFVETDVKLIYVYQVQCCCQKKYQNHDNTSACGEKVFLM